MIKDILTESDEKVKADIESCVSRKCYSKVNSISIKYRSEKRFILKSIKSVDERIRDLLNSLEK
mgnify:CR=1